MGVTPPTRRAGLRALGPVLGVATATAIALLSQPDATAMMADASNGSTSATPPALPTALRAPVAYSNGRPSAARLTIPAIGVRRVPVIAYRGKTDDARGTRIEDRGIAASPYGPRGGTGPGGVGNYQVTGHRTSDGGVFGRAPSLRRGDTAYVDAGRWRYVYRIVTTRWVSFRSATSLRAQRAAVPGHPGRRPTRGYLTISTCATLEDHARGNYWHDRLGNPEHRIDKIGVLMRRVPNPYVPAQRT